MPPDNAIHAVSTPRPYLVHGLHGRSRGPQCPKSCCIAVLQGGELKASIAFPALALFDLFRNPIRLIPDSLNMLISASVAMNRLQAYLDVRPILDMLHPSLT